MTPEEKRERQRAAVRRYRAKNREKCLALTRAWRDANPEKAEAARVAWRARNPERHAATKARYYEEKKAHRAAVKAAWRARNAAHIKAKKFAWRVANREQERASRARYVRENLPKFRLASQMRKARKLAQAGNVSPDIVSRLMTLQRGCCAACRCDVRTKYHLDHVMPLSRGGMHDDDNLQLLCPTCNMRKGAKPPEIFMRDAGFLL